ncbi:MAG: hypothetical protein HDS40_02925 [Bacteroides sp.]|nr:hypothetical protein [Bacteroides sp.]
MIKEENYITPSKETVYKMYTYLKNFERSLANETGAFDFSSAKFQKFLIDKDILLKPVSKARYVQDLPRKNYIVYVYGDRKEGAEDKAHDLLRHLRNAIGHALISKIAHNKPILDITDRNRKGTVTMRGNIDEKLLFEIIEQIIATKKQ